MTKSSVNNLLRVLRSHQCFPFLPKSYKTLIKTPRNVSLVPMAPGKYFHAGFKDGIIDALENSSVDINSLSKLKVFINTDGTSVSDSNVSELWPILGRLLNVESTPFEIGLYHGPGKPTDFNDFLRRFVEEANSLLENGIEYNGKTIRVEIHCFSCDALALSGIKFIIQHGGYHSRTKCETEGVYVNNASGRGGRVTFPETDAPLRTHESFVNQMQPEHHNGRSILENLRNIDMVKSFTIDAMHLVFIGVIAKILHLFNSCRRKIRTRVLKSQVDAISNFLASITNCIPVEFARKTRTLKQLARYKASEFRLLLLYILPVALSLLPKELYEHFLLLHCAIRILSCPKLVRERENVEYARTLLLNFVTSSSRLYGDEFLVYNVHNLIHLADEVLRFGPLDVFSCAPFENHIGMLKNLVQPTNRPLAQLAKRIMERRFNNIRRSANTKQTGMHQPHNNGPTIPRVNGIQFKKLNYNGLLLSIRSCDNCAILSNGDVFEIENFVKTARGEMLMLGRILLPIRSLYNYPMDSRILGTFVVSSSPRELQSFPVTRLSNKAIKIPLPNCLNEFAIIPFLHVQI